MREGDAARGERRERRHARQAIGAQGVDGDEEEVRVVERAVVREAGRPAAARLVRRRGRARRGGQALGLARLGVSRRRLQPLDGVEHQRRRRRLRVRDEADVGVEPRQRRAAGDERHAERQRRPAP